MPLACFRWIVLACSYTSDPVFYTSASLDPSIVIYRSGGVSAPSWFIHLPDGTMVYWGLQFWNNVYLYNLYIYLPQLRFGGVSGLCGSWNGNATDDLMGMYSNISECTYGPLMVMNAELP